MTALPTLLCTANFPSNTGYAWDFIEHLYSRIADRLVECGVRTIVAYPEIADPPKKLLGTPAGFVVLDTELKTQAARARMAEFIRRENVQVVYLTDRPLWSLWYPYLRRAGVRRIIVHDHASGERNRPTGIRRIIKRVLVNLPGVAADVILAVSDFVAERDRATSLISPDKIRRVWNGIDPLPASGENLPDVRDLLALSEDTPVIGCACRATREKGVDILFRAFDRVWCALENCALEDCVLEASPVLVYIGNGPQLEQLLALRATLRSAAYIHLLGYLPRAADLLRNSTVCVVPSLWEEAFGLAVLEMMARGRTVIATSVGGIPEIIQADVSGLLVPPNDVNALAGALRTVLGSAELRDALGHEARQRASQLFTVDRQISEILETFQDIFSH